MSNPNKPKAIMRTRLTWISLFLIEAAGVMAAWIFATGRWQVNPTGSIPHLIAGLLLAVAIFVAFLVLFVTPAFILGSCLIVKRAIESAQRNDYKQVHSYLFGRKWFVFLPLPKHAEIVCILRQLCEDRKTKPKGMSPAFSQYVVPDDFGNYVLSWEGKEEMLKLVNSGWLFNAEKAENFTSPTTFNWLMRIVVIVAIIRGIALIIHILTRH